MSPEWLQMEVSKAYLTGRISPDEKYEDLLSFPRYFEIETVNACNARCPMCTIDDWDRRDGLMSDELFEKVANEIIEHPEVKRVHLYRDGEPLLDKHLSEKVEKLRPVNEVGISTNGQLLSMAVGKRLLQTGLDSIILSIDSLKKEVYEAIRVNCEFETVMQNAHDFILMRNALKSNCQIWVRMIRQESNKEEWPAYEKYWKGLLRSSDRVDYRNLHNWGAQLRGADVGVDNKPCVALWSLMCIFADGSVPMCNVDYNKKYPLGNVRDSTIKELWQSKLQNERRALHLSGDRQIPICKGCTTWDEHANARSDSL